MESVWAIALGKSEGFTHVGPTIVFIVALVLSMLGLSFAVKTLPKNARVEIELIAEAK